MRTIETQSEEFRTASLLRAAMAGIEATPVVADDYPMVRLEYERALADFIKALKANGRITKDDI